MITTTTWRHNLTNYSNLDNVNESGQQQLQIFQPLASNKIRFQLSNLYDEVPLKINAFTIKTDASLTTSITLDNMSEFEVPARLSVWSDWIDFDLSEKTFLTINIASSNTKVHTAGLTISNDLIKTRQTDAAEPKYFFGISAIQIQTENTFQRLAFFGDSLTNQGNFSAPLAIDLESNFKIMTANFGISGNRILHPGHSTSPWSNSFGEAGLTRFDHMLVDYQPNVVIFMEGINDLLHPGTGAPLIELPTATAIIQAIYQLRKKAHDLGITFIPMTITPANGNMNDEIPGWNNQKEDLRLTINHAIRQLPHCIDLSDLVSNGSYLKTDFDCGDHVHFSKNGGKIVADYVKEQLIRQKII